MNPIYRAKIIIYVKCSTGCTGLRSGRDAVVTVLILAGTLATGSRLCVGVERSLGDTDNYPREGVVRYSRFAILHSLRAYISEESQLEHG